MSEHTTQPIAPLDRYGRNQLRIFGADVLSAEVGMRPSFEQIHELAVTAETVCTNPGSYMGRPIVNIDPTGYQSTYLPTPDGRPVMIYWNPENNPYVSGMPIIANIAVRGFRNFVAVEKKSGISLRRPRTYQVEDTLYITADNYAGVLRTLRGENEVGPVPKNRAKKPATADEVELVIDAIVEGVRHQERTISKRYS